MLRVVLCALIAALVVPASASAATLIKSGSTLTYTATAGRTNLPTFTVDGFAIRVGRDTGDDDALVNTGCNSAGGGEYTCTGIVRIVIDTGDGDDVVSAAGMSVPVQVNGGAGDDQLRTGSGADALAGGDGQDVLSGGGGNDTLDGGAGDDELDGGGNSDKLIGGAGVDVGFYTAAAASPAPSVSLDGVANDGLPGENDDFGTDIEDVTLGGSLGIVVAASTVSGSAVGNILTTDNGNDTISGGAGIDTIEARGGNDTIDVRDGYPDRVDCGKGTDTVGADTLDVVGANCETVNVADAGSALDDRPPTIAWTAPAAGAKVSTTATLSVTATDDRGVALVRFLDDDRVVCEVAAAPYTCAYAPRGDDVGRDTLTAIAVDSGGQTASVQRVVTVNRFRAAISLSVRSRGSTFTAGGKIDQPATVTRSQACKGTVTVRVKSGGKTLATKKGKLTSRCTFSVRGLRVKGSRLRFTAAFAGNSYLQSRSRTVSPTTR